jgi:hypothetical protein
MQTPSSNLRPHALHLQFPGAMNGSHALPQSPQCSSCKYSIAPSSSTNVLEHRSSNSTHHPAGHKPMSPPSSKLRRCRSSLCRPAISQSTCEPQDRSSIYSSPIPQVLLQRKLVVRIRRAPLTWRIRGQHRCFSPHNMISLDHIASRSSRLTASSSPSIAFALSPGDVAQRNPLWSGLQLQLSCSSCHIECICASCGV